MNTRKLIPIGVALVALALAGCAPSKPLPTYSGPATPTAHATGTPAPGSTATATPAPGSNGLYPAQDTALSNAPIAMQNAWVQYVNDTIPGQEVFASMPALPQIVNQSNGAISDADAHALVAAMWRSEALQGWAEAHQDLGLDSALFVSNVIDPKVAGVINQGGVVHEPACNLYPTQIVFKPMSAQTKAYFDGAKEPTGAKVVMVQTYSGPCLVTATVGGQTTTLENLTGLSGVLVAGQVETDPALGTYFHEDSGGSCSDQAAPADVCRS